MAEFKTKEEYEKWKAERSTAMPQVKASAAVKSTPPALKEKSVPLAIGLNIVLPGAGYMYMGKVLLGITALCLMILIAFSTPIMAVSSIWIGLNVIMAIDMMLLNSKRQKSIRDATMVKCPFCAELIKKEAVVCRFCNREVASIGEGKIA